MKRVENENGLDLVENGVGIYVVRVYIFEDISQMHATTCNFRITATNNGGDGKALPGPIRIHFPTGIENSLLSRVI